VRRRAAGVRDDGLPARAGVPRLHRGALVRSGERSQHGVAVVAYRNEGAFCEALAVKIRDDIAEALQLDASRVAVTLEQKARGGITITATA
jgi:hypothetical protein